MDVCGNCGRTRKQGTTFCTGCGCRFADDNPQPTRSDNPFGPPGPSRPADSPAASASQESAGYYAPTGTFLAEGSGSRAIPGGRGIPGPAGPSRTRRALAARGRLRTPSTWAPLRSRWTWTIPSLQALQRRVHRVDVQARRPRDGGGPHRRGRAPAARCSICGIIRRMPKRHGTMPSRPSPHRVPPRSARFSSQPGRAVPRRRRARRIPRRIPPGAGAVTAGRARPRTRRPHRSRTSWASTSPPYTRDYQSYFSLPSPRFSRG